VDFDDLRAHRDYYVFEERVSAELSQTQYYSRVPQKHSKSLRARCSSKHT
jgi:hypothetical protein